MTSAFSAFPVPADFRVGREESKLALVALYSNKAVLHASRRTMGNGRGPLFARSRNEAETPR